MNFTSTDNKGMIWGLLQESNIFAGIENERFANIQSLFEDTIESIHVNNMSSSLLEKNKLTMETMISKINVEKSKPKKTIQVVYKAEDLQHKRTEDFNMKLKAQQDSMNSMMNVSKPKEVTFSDETNDDDKPIGDEMDRLIAERLASRERELEIPSMTKETEAWLNTRNTSNTSNTSNVSSTSSNSNNANITLNNNTNDELLEIATNANTNTNAKEKSFDADSIFSKLKRKTQTAQSESVQSNIVQSENEITISNIRDEIMKLKNEQETIKQTCLQILELVKQKDRI